MAVRCHRWRTMSMCFTQPTPLLETTDWCRGHRSGIDGHATTVNFMAAARRVGRLPTCISVIGHRVSPTCRRLPHCIVLWLGWRRGPGVLLQAASAHSQPLPLIHRLPHVSTLERHYAPRTKSLLTRSSPKASLFTALFTAGDHGRFMT